jgi:hypothetical protein
MAKKRFEVTKKLSEIIALFFAPSMRHFFVETRCIASLHVYLFILRAAWFCALMTDAVIRNGCNMGSPM